MGGGDGCEIAAIMSTVSLPPDSLNPTLTIGLLSSRAQALVAYSTCNSRPSGVNCGVVRS